MSVVITGATGHIGRRIVHILREEFRDVRVVGRNANTLQPWADSGAQAFVGDMEDSAFLTRAFDKAEAVFAMIPPNPRAEDFRAFQNRVGASIAAAVEKTGIERVVNLSSQGAHLPKGTGPIAGLYDQEQRLNAIRHVHVVHLRPAYFMENLMTNIHTIRSRNVNGTPLRGDLVFPMIATRDIAATAADYLLRLTFAEKTVRDLLGQRELSMNEATRILGHAINKPGLSYVQFPYDEAEKAMTGSGMSRDMARLYIEMNRALNEGHIMSGVERTVENTTQTSFETFAMEFATAYRKGETK